MNVNPNATSDTTDLDARITTTEQARANAERAHGALIEERLRTRLRAVFPDGGALLVLTGWDESGGEVAVITEITDADGAAYDPSAFGFADFPGLIGADTYAAIIDDLTVAAFDLRLYTWYGDTAEVEF